MGANRRDRPWLNRYGEATSARRLDHVAGIFMQICAAGGSLVIKANPCRGRSSSQ